MSVFLPLATKIYLLCICGVVYESMVGVILSGSRSTLEILHVLLPLVSLTYSHNSFFHISLSFPSLLFEPKKTVWPHAISLHVCIIRAKWNHDGILWDPVGSILSDWDRLCFARSLDCFVWLSCSNVCFCGLVNASLVWLFQGKTKTKINIIYI